MKVPKALVVLLVVVVVAFAASAVLVGRAEPPGKVPSRSSLGWVEEIKNHTSNPLPEAEVKGRECLAIVRRGSICELDVAPGKPRRRMLVALRAGAKGRIEFAPRGKGAVGFGAKVKIAPGKNEQELSVPEEGAVVSVTCEDATQPCAFVLSSTTSDSKP